MSKINLLLVFGGTSSEHSISILSAQNIIKAISKKKYNITLVYITKNGHWHLLDKTIKINEKILNSKIKSIPESYLIINKNKGQLLNIDTKKMIPIDVCFPILHGSYGEDGTIQGLCKAYNIKCVGSDILGSVINLDKTIEKTILQSHNIKTAKFLTFTNQNDKNLIFSKIKKTLGYPFFIKPANTGSSVGINKIHNEKEFKNAIKEAFKYDKKIIIEQCIVGKEIECSVLGNSSPKASLPGQIIPKSEFYSYNSKYIDPNGAQLIIPAKLSKNIIKKIQTVAIQAYTILECRGFARVDMFLTKNNGIFINELNTIPGFTNISMFPKLWEISGIDYSDLIDEIIQLSLESKIKE